MIRKTMEAFEYNPSKVEQMIRTVVVDMGNGPHEYLQYATVIRESEINGLFDNNPYKVLLVELPGGERVWVSEWTELPVTLSK